MTSIKNVTAIVLAAGTSRRFQGSNKLLAPFKGAPVLAGTIKNLKDAGLETILVVTGFDHAETAALATRAGATVLENAAFDQGIATSIATGIGPVAPDCNLALIVLGDMPEVSPETIQALCRALGASDKKIAVPVYKQKWGNPVLWHRDFFPLLAGLSGDRGAKKIMKAHPEALIEVAVDDPGIHLDFDTREGLDGHPKGS